MLIEHNLFIHVPLGPKPCKIGIITALHYVSGSLFKRVGELKTAFGPDFNLNAAGLIKVFQG